MGQTHGQRQPNKGLVGTQRDSKGLKGTQRDSKGLGGRFLPCKQRCRCAAWTAMPWRPTLMSSLGAPNKVPESCTIVLSPHAQVAGPYIIYLYWHSMLHCSSSSRFSSCCFLWLSIQLHLWLPENWTQKPSSGLPTNHGLQSSAAPTDCISCSCAPAETWRVPGHKCWMCSNKLTLNPSLRNEMRTKHIVEKNIETWWNMENMSGDIWIPYIHHTFSLSTGCSKCQTFPPGPAMESRLAGSQPLPRETINHQPSTQFSVSSEETARVTKFCIELINTDHTWNFV